MTFLINSQPTVAPPITTATHTAHTLNPVEVVVYSQQHKGSQLAETGALGDIAPTILQLMGLEQPAAMTGKSLIV